MEIILKAGMFDGIDKIERLNIKVDDTNWRIVRQTLHYQRQRIINGLKTLHEYGEIKSIRRPKNKRIQKELDELISLKKDLADGIEYINTVFT